MQYPFSCSPSTYAAIEATLSQPRLGRYLSAAGGDRHLALRFYVWNARLCEAFYVPTQLAEIALRNALARGLGHRYGHDWHIAPAFVSALPFRLKNELEKVISEEHRKHGSEFIADHVVSEISLGFWVHLTSTKPRQYVWLGNIRQMFPHLPQNQPESVTHAASDRLRKFRNRIAHHNAVFDKGPTAEHRNVQDLIGGICPDTLWLLRQISNPAQIISRRPK